MSARVFFFDALFYNKTLAVTYIHIADAQIQQIILAMEASEKEALVKAKSLQRMYSDHFLDVLFTIHPSGRPGEIRGKSSNVAWAASEMVRRTQQGSCSRDLSSILLTVMDADTCFAQDYFALLESHYRAASLEERKKMMFAPCTVFDRCVLSTCSSLFIQKTHSTTTKKSNANQVSPIVRIADMLWSAGVMSNLYDSSPIKFPCSAYSLPLSLVHAVGYWDTDAHAIGEDMHMFLKCFFATSGQLEVKTIYSPASQCNVEGTWWGDGIAARYGQAKRHMWGCLDSGYVLRRSLFGLLAPGYDSVEGGEIVKVDRVPLERPPHQLFELPLDKLLTLVHRSLEAHVFMVCFFVFPFCMLQETKHITTGTRLSPDYPHNAHCTHVLKRDNGLLGFIH